MLTVEQVSDELALEEVTVRRWLAAGKLPGYKLGSQWRIDPRELNAYLKACRLAGPSSR